MDNTSSNNVKLNETTKQKWCIFSNKGKRKHMTNPNK